MCIIHIKYIPSKCPKTFRENKYKIIMPKEKKKKNIKNYPTQSYSTDYN